MNVSRVGMTVPQPTKQAQPSFKGWITDGQVAFRDSTVKSIYSSNGGDYATLKFYDGKTLNTHLSTNELLKNIEKARKEGICRVGEYDFMI